MKNIHTYHGFGVWFATVKQFPDVAAKGSTEQEAIQRVSDAFDRYLTQAIKELA